MGRRILREMVNGAEMFIVWSSIVDAPITFAMTQEEFRLWWSEEYGRAGREQLDGHFARGDFGTLEDELVVNRAGADETSLTREQIIDFYFVRKGEGEQPVGTTYSDEDPELCSQCGADVLGYHRCETAQ